MLKNAALLLHVRHNSFLPYSERTSAGL